MSLHGRRLYDRPVRASGLDLTRAGPASADHPGHADRLRAHAEQVAADLARLEGRDPAETWEESEARYAAWLGRLKATRKAAGRKRNGGH